MEAEGVGALAELETLEVVTLVRDADGNVTIDGQGLHEDAIAAIVASAFVIWCLPGSVPGIVVSDHDGEELPGE